MAVLKAKVAKATDFFKLTTDAQHSTDFLRWYQPVHVSCQSARLIRWERPGNKTLTGLIREITGNHLCSMALNRNELRVLR